MTDANARIVESKPENLSAETRAQIGAMQDRTRKLCGDLLDNIARTAVLLQHDGDIDAEDLAVAVGVPCAIDELIGTYTVARLRQIEQLAGATDEEKTSTFNKSVALLITDIASAIKEAQRQVNER